MGFCSVTEDCRRTEVKRQFFKSHTTQAPPRVSAEESHNAAFHYGEQAIRAEMERRVDKWRPNK